MTLPIRIGDFLYKNWYSAYWPIYSIFKRWQDSFEISLLRNHINDGDVVLDIGSNIGFYSILFSRLVGHGKVHCFEPDELNFNRLQTNCNGFGNVILNKVGVSERTETLRFYISNMLNVDHKTYKPASYEKEVTIDAVSIDDHMGNNGRINFIKIDIQGFECHALKGMHRTIKMNKRVKMLSEFWPYGLRQSGSSATEYFNQLTELGFTVDLIEGRKLTRMDFQKVKELEMLEERPEIYFNVFASKNTG